MIYNQEQIILQTIYAKQENSSIKSAVYNQERVIMARGRCTLTQHAEQLTHVVQKGQKSAAQYEALSYKLLYFRIESFSVFLFINQTKSFCISVLLLTSTCLLLLAFLYYAFLSNFSFTVLNP